MNSWWELGEWSENRGNDLSTRNIECPFCGEKGNYSTEYHAQKKKPNSSKELNHDTLKCGSCSSYVMVLWSADGNLHSYKVLPWPLNKITKYPEGWPEVVGRYWIQAKRNIKDESQDASALMARSSLQIALRDQNANGKNLKQEINDFAEKGILPKIMQEWARRLSTDLSN